MRHVLFLLALGACTPATPTPIDSTPLPTPTPACASVALDACGDTPGCAPLLGTPLGVDLGGDCLLDPAPEGEVLACLDAEVTCPPVVVYAREAADQPIYEIAAGCTPDGWEDVGADFSVCDACNDVALDGCDATAGCQLLSGRLVDTSGAPCVDPTAPSEPLACVAQTDCAAVETVAGPPEGPEYVFPSSCVPPGWVAGGSYPECAVTCEDVSLADCASADGCMLLSGRELQPDGAGGLCEDPSVPTTPLGCTEDAACGDMITYGSSGGVTYWFPDTCRPSGFTVEPGPYDACP